MNSQPKFFSDTQVTIITLLIIAVGLLFYIFAPFGILLEVVSLVAPALLGLGFLGVISSAGFYVFRRRKLAKVIAVVSVMSLLFSALLYASGLAGS